MGNLDALGGIQHFKAMPPASNSAKNMILLALSLGAITRSIAAPAVTSPAAAESLLNLPRPLVISHRGFSQRAPENTLPAFRLAKAAGADLIELDYHHSKDGVPVVIHDAELDRTTDAVARWGRQQIPVASKSAAELRTLDAGGGSSPDMPTRDFPRWRKHWIAFRTAASRSSNARLGTRPPA